MPKNDKISKHILQELSRDGRISNLELAERVGLSPSACLRRVQELERSGVICGYRAVLDRQKLGVGFATYIGVGLGEHTKEAQEAFEHAMNAAPEVVECHNITGTIEWRCCATRFEDELPLSAADSSITHDLGGAEGRESVHESDADVDFGGLSVWVPRHDAFAECLEA